MPYIEQVVQFMVPASLSIWMQRAGRAGRTFSISARAILLVQPSVFQEVKKKNGVPIPESDATVYRKDVEEGLREWIETEDCRREVADVYFDSGVARTGNIQPWERNSANLLYQLPLAFVAITVCGRRTLIIHYSPNRPPSRARDPLPRIPKILHSRNPTPMESAG